MRMYFAGVLMWKSTEISATEITWLLLHVGVAVNSPDRRNPKNPTHITAQSMTLSYNTGGVDHTLYTARKWSGIVGSWWGRVLIAGEF